MKLNRRRVKVLRACVPAGHATERASVPTTAYRWLIYNGPIRLFDHWKAGLKNDCACVRRGGCLSFRSFDQWKVWRWTRPFPGNVCLQDGTERRSLWTFSVNGNSLTCWKDSRGMFVYLDSLKPADKFLKASLLCGNDGRSWWVGLIDFIHFKNIIELLSSELSMDVTW